MPIRCSSLIVLAAIPVLVLAGCAPAADPTSAPSSSASAPTPATTTATATAPTEEPTDDPADESEDDSSELDDDIVLSVDATATASNGAVLQLNLQVHQSERWDDANTSDRADLMTETCDGSLDNTVYSANLWSFTEIDYEAVHDDSTPGWPADGRVSLLPATKYLAVAADGFIRDDNSVDTATPFCKRDKFITGAGDGETVVGFAGDTDDVGAAGGYTKWANHRYGFVSGKPGASAAASAGVLISDCTYTVTDVGAEYHGGAAWWKESKNSTKCTIGSGEKEDHDS